MKVFTDADAYLGSSDSRFFSSGYKKVSYELADEEVLNNSYSASLRLTYPEDWSVKKKNRLPPHLSSIDVMLMSARSCGEILASRNKEKFEISQMTIRASRKPLEDLNSVYIIFDVMSESELTVMFVGKVGNMNVALEVTNRESNDLQLSSTFSIEGFKNSKQSIENIKLKNILESEAIVIKTVNGERCEHIDYIDAFVSGLQLGQILLYELDDITREESNNLWMRNIVLKLSPKENTHLNNNLEVVLENITLIKKDDTEWRCADIVAKLNNIQLRCSITHQLNR